MRTHLNKLRQHLNEETGTSGTSSPGWFWFSEIRTIPERLKAALSPKTCKHVGAVNPTDFLLSNRSNFNNLGQILVLDGSVGQSDMIQLWLRHLRRDPVTSAMPILVWSHSGKMNTFENKRDSFRLLPDGVIGRKGWIAQEKWIERIETILASRMKRKIHIDVHLDMSSRPDALEMTSEWILNCARLIPWMTDKQARLRQAIYEIGQNAIEWGNHGDISKNVHMRLRADDRCLHLLVSDEGDGFDRKNLPHAAVEEDPIRHIEIREQLGIRDGGFGLLITRGIVDRMVYNSSGNTVLMTMRHQSEKTQKLT